MTSKSSRWGHAKPAVSVNGDSDVFAQNTKTVKNENNPKFKVP